MDALYLTRCKHHESIVEDYERCVDTYRSMNERSQRECRRLTAAVYVLGALLGVSVGLNVNMYLAKKESNGTVVREVD